MDSKSHVEFALRLLPSGMEAAALTSLFPQIDRRPATLHRNYAHHLTKVRCLSRMGWSALKTDLEIKTRGDLPSETEKDYVKGRFKEEEARIRAYLDIELPSVIDEEFLAGAEMAYVSHLYLDTFNQPVQAFTPTRSVVSGQFELWDRVGDFRYRLYVEGVVEDLRREWLRSSIWQKKFSVAEITHAMVVRLAQLAGKNETSFIDEALVRADFKDLNTVSSSSAVAWLQDLEYELFSLHIRYLG